MRDAAAGEAGRGLRKTLFAIIRNLDFIMKVKGVEAGS